MGRDARMWLTRLSEGVAVQGHSRMWWGYLACGLIMAAILIGWRVYRSGEKVGFRGFIKQWLAPHFWRKTTTWVDLKLWGVMHVFDMFWGAFASVLIAGVSVNVAYLLGGAYRVLPPETYGAATIALITILITLADDFSRYVNHYLRHKIPFFWAFHRVHHSSERMTMISNIRLHPFDRVVQLICSMAISGPLLGVISWAFGGFDFWLLFGVNIFYAVKNVFFSNLQHTHVRWDLPKPLCYIFISPSVHQIHHSRLDHHWDKNYGEVFAIWDWMFGTLYLPKPKERIVFGLAREFGVERPRPHRTLLQALFEPLSFIAKTVRGSSPEKASASPEKVT